MGLQREDSHKGDIMKKKMRGQAKIILILSIIYLHIQCSHSFSLDKSLNLLTEEEEFQQDFTETPPISNDPSTIIRPGTKAKLPPGPNCRKGRVWDEKLRKCVFLFS